MTQSYIIYYAVGIVIFLFKEGKCHRCTSADYIMLTCVSVTSNCMKKINGYFWCRCVWCGGTDPAWCWKQEVKRFEFLTYDVYQLRLQHERVRRSTTGSGKQINLQFQSHGRNFHVRLVPDDTVFHPDLEVVSSQGEKIEVDISHIYHGTLYGKKNSIAHGSIINGIFRGVIHDPDKGVYYIEENHDFFGGGRGQSPIGGYRGHSVMYHEKDVEIPERYKSQRYCGVSNTSLYNRMLKFQSSSSLSRKSSKIPRSRKSRQVDRDKTTCLLYVQTDHVLYKLHPSNEKILSVIAEHVKAANTIYRSTEFKTSTGEKMMNLNVKVQRIKINDSSVASDQNNPFRSDTIGVEKYLELLSQANHNDYCLAYAFTNRDFDNGVLGLAWVGATRVGGGGICERYRKYGESESKSLNTGLVTFKNYGSIISSLVSHITFAHELGHNFGSPHDDGKVCTPGNAGSLIGGLGGNGGNYIMYDRATTGKNPNNDNFSPCSIGNMSKVLEARKDSCFIDSKEPICGNQIVDGKGEECDCGYTDNCAHLNDKCCIPADDADTAMRCKLKTGATCSTSQGPCCDGNTCNLAASTVKCALETDCQEAQYCDPSRTPECPPVRLKGSGKTLCESDTKVCVRGECTGSICLLHNDIEECECSVPEGSTDRSVLCHSCCQMLGNPSSCKSVSDPAFGSRFTNNKTILLKPGSPCDNYNGYCDVFSKCRAVDANGPISRIKQAILNPLFYSNLKKWLISYWWGVVLIGLGFIALMVLFVKFCSFHTPSSNPAFASKEKVSSGSKNSWASKIVRKTPSVPV